MIAALGPELARALDASVTAAEPFQRADIAWRFAEDYDSVRTAAGFHADIAGFLPVADVAAALRRALALADPWIRVFAAASLLRVGETVDDAILDELAASHEVRVVLWDQLSRLGQLARFPARFATLDAFAAANMVEWLKYPAELGREPDRLERMATFESEHATLYVWRFTGHDGTWLAATSGPYERTAIGPVHGSSTFSRFETWDSATPEGHATAILETLEGWRRG